MALKSDTKTDQGEIKMKNLNFNIQSRRFRNLILLYVSIFFPVASNASQSYTLHATACIESIPGEAVYDMQGIKNNDFWDYYICPILRRNTLVDRLTSVKIDYTVNTGSFVSCIVHATSPLTGSTETSPAKSVSGVSGTSLHQQFQWSQSELPIAPNNVATYSTNCVLGGSGITWINSLSIVE